jgi:hypothetical protein
MALHAGTTDEAAVARPEGGGAISGRSIIVVNEIFGPT